jgi:hypothetical protein
VSADAPPDDVGLTGADLIAVFKGRSAVRRPTHLPDPRMPLHPLDAEARMKALLRLLQISDELPEGSQKRSLLLGSKTLPIPPK